MFLPKELAETLLENYLSIYYHLTPFYPASTFEQMLQQLYGGASSNTPNGSFDRLIVMAAMAIGGCVTEHLQWADTLYEKAKNGADALSEVVNCRAVQLSLLLISSHSTLILHR